MTFYKAYLNIFKVSALVYILVGFTWTITNLGDIPHYGDTNDYFHLAKDLQVNEHRGIVYPWVLSIAVQYLLEGRTPVRIGPKSNGIDRGLNCVLPQKLAWLQIAQTIIFAMSLLFFVWVLLIVINTNKSTNQVGNKIGFLMTFSLLLFDPMISHYNLALMTDSLTLSACLLFCGALIAFANKQLSFWIVVLILAISFMLASGLRVEKKWVLLSTVIFTSIYWLWKNNKNLIPSVSKKQLVLINIVIVICLSLSILIQNTNYKKTNTMTSYESFIHFRIGFTNLNEHYDDLPERTREWLTRSNAKHYDQRINGVRSVLRNVVGSDQKLRREFTEDVLLTILPNKWWIIFADVLGDSMKNTLSTFSHYMRLYTSSDPIERGPIGHHHPKLTKLYLSLGSFIMILALPLSIIILYRNRKKVFKCQSAAPSLIFCLVNGIFFGLAFNYINFRYGLFSHVIILILIYHPVVNALFNNSEIVESDDVNINKISVE